MSAMQVERSYERYPVEVCAVVKHPRSFRRIEGELWVALSLRSHSVKMTSSWYESKDWKAGPVASFGRGWMPLAWHSIPRCTTRSLSITHGYSLPPKGAKKH